MRRTCFQDGIAYCEGFSAALEFVEDSRVLEHDGTYEDVAALSMVSAYLRAKHPQARCEGGSVGWPAQQQISG